MFEKKKLALLLATAVFAAACGGGGGGGVAGDTTNTAGGNTNGANPNPPPTNTPGDTQTIPATDERLNGFLHMSANQLVFIPADRRQMWGYSYNGSPIEYFEETGLEIASGGAQEDMNAEIPPSAIAPGAPIANFGFRVLNEVIDSTGNVQAGAQTVIGRVGLDFIERPQAGGVQAGETAERVTIIIDNVELATNAGGRLISARALPSARVYVRGVNAAGAAVNETFAAPENSVRLMPLYHVADNYGDTSAQVLMVDPEQAFSQAGDRVQSLHSLRGEFDMHLTFSSVNLVRPAKPVTDEPALDRRDLIGQPIQMTNHTTLNGGGVSGKVWIRRYLPQP